MITYRYLHAQASGGGLKHDSAPVMGLDALLPKTVSEVPVPVFGDPAADFTRKEVYNHIGNATMRETYNDFDHETKGGGS